MKLLLSASDLFTLFNSACKSVGSPGYTGTWSNQSRGTVQAWEQFHQLVSQYVADTALVTKAVGPSTIASEDAMRRMYENMDDAERLKHYRYLNALGCRM